MEFQLLGWPEDDPALRLDFRTFSYAGKFVMTNTGKAVVRTGESIGDRGIADVADRSPTSAADRSPTSAADPDNSGTTRDDWGGPPIDPDVFADDVVAAIAFNEDRTDESVLWLRYVTVHEAYRGEGFGPRLATFVVDRAEERGYHRTRIAVNNPFAYEALYKAGFVFTGRETGLSEVVLERPGERDGATYQCGLDVFRDRDLSAAESRFLSEKEGADPPAVVEAEAPARVRASDAESVDGAGDSALHDGSCSRPDASETDL